jgi:lipopolysaccharide export system protein LptA
MKKTDFLPRILIFAFILTLPVPGSAERITFYADNMSGTAGSTSDTTKLEGNAYVRTASMEIAADSITMSGKNFRYIEAEGNIDGRNIDTKMEFKCSSMSYDRETKTAILRDNVHLDDTENKVSADAQIIEYNQNTDIAILQIDISLKQKDNVCKGAYAVYRKKAQMLELSGNSQITQGEDTFRAQEITLNLNSQEITLDGRVKGSVIDDKSKKDSDQPAGGSGDRTSSVQDQDGSEPEPGPPPENGSTSPGTDKGASE